MKVFRDSLEAAGKIKDAVVTTGSFDGVHIGHKLIIHRLNQLAEQINGESSLITFYPHPRKVLYPEQKDLKLINSQDEKIELLSKTGLRNLIIIPFSVEFSRTSSHDFITNILIKQLNAKVIIVGHNHHFGHNRSGDFSYLHELSRQHGFQVEDIPLKDIENETVSSTKIRKALLEGNIMRANAYLDHQYIISGRMIPSDFLQNHDDQHFWEVQITEEEKLIPPPGVYATQLKLKDECHKTMTIIVSNEMNGCRVYNLILGYSKDIKGISATLYFHKKIRGPEIFFGAEINKDELTEATEDIDELIY